MNSPNIESTMPPKTPELVQHAVKSGKSEKSKWFSILLQKQLYFVCFLKKNHVRAEVMVRSISLLCLSLCSPNHSSECRMEVLRGSLPPWNIYEKMHHCKCAAATAVGALVFPLSLFPRLFHARVMVPFQCIVSV